MVEWSKLKTYDEDQPHSFEELCYQIAKGLHGDEGKFTRVDDSGGGDGVEFYLTFPNGDQWGWQAKFYYTPTPRLSVSSRKTQIKKSLKKACENHPNLKKWILCTPSNFTPSENIWFNEKLIESVPEAEGVELEHWGSSEFNDSLTKPSFNGKRLFFFGELELNMDWFCKQYKKQISLIKNKFNPILHSETHIEEYLHFLLADKILVNETRYLIEDLEYELHNLNEKREVKSNYINSIYFRKYVDFYDNVESLEKLIHELLAIFQQICCFINKKRHDEARNLLNSVDKNFDYLFDDCYYYYRKITESKENSYTNTYDILSDYDDIHKEEHERILKDVSKIYQLLNNIESYVNIIFDNFKSINQTDLHILGEAGVGKTHISSNICYELLKFNSPAIIVLGRHFVNNNPLGDQLKSILDIPSSYSLTNFFEALQTAAEAYHVRIPLIIDGLNESLYNGRFSDVWTLGLPGLIQEMKEYKNLVLITTCRNTYFEAIWKEEKPKIKKLSRSNFKNLKNAVDTYFDFYKIEADITITSLNQFEHPIYLKIFCETKNHYRKEKKNVFIGDDTLFEIFEEYLMVIDDKLREKFNLHSSVSVLKPSFEKIAKYLWNEKRNDVPIAKLVEFIDNSQLNDLDWYSSRTNAIIDEGLLINRDWIDGNEVFYFTYDLMGGFLIAKYLIEQRDISDTSKLQEIEHNLFNNDYEKLNPLYEDIARSLSALLPIKTNKYLHEILDNQIAFETSIKALFEISPEKISSNCIELVTNLFKEQNYHNSLLEFAFNGFLHTKHSLNILFWSKQLKELSIADRDLCWTEFVRKNIDIFIRHIENLEEICKNDGDFSKLTRDRLYLLAITVMWCLTSTVQQLRDKATRSLYWYGRKFPKELWDMTLISLEIDDPYVSERMLAAIYGVCMARQHDFKDKTFSENLLPIYGQGLYNLMFKENSTYSTTHILKREYAQRIIEISLIHHPNILFENEKERIIPPYIDGGIRNWGKSADQDEGKYKEMENPIEGILQEDPVSALGPEMDTYNESPEYVEAKSNLWWRIYQFGYSLDLFGKIDRSIGEWNLSASNYDGNKWTGTYGGKYVSIAVAELAGYRDDQGLLKEDFEDTRTSMVDIDPSFPIELKQYHFKNDFLDKPSLDSEWLVKDENSILKEEYLEIEELNGEKGPWILLNCQIHQRSNYTKRKITLESRGLFIKPEDEKQIFKNFEEKNPLNRGIPRIYGDYYIYAGEIPWCDIFPENGWDKLSFKVGKKTVKVPIKKKVVMCNDIPLSTDETEKLWDSIVDKVTVIPKEKYLTPDDFDAEKIQELSKKAMDIEHKIDDSGDVILSSGDISRVYTEFGSIISPRGTNPKEILNSELEKKGLEIGIMEIEIEEERPEYKKFEVLVPVRNNHWEMHHSPIIPNRNVVILNKEISKSLKLHNKPQSFDFYENNGEKASIMLNYNGTSSKHTLIYIRQDLLNLFLDNENLKFIWHNYCEKECSSNETDYEIKEFRQTIFYK